MFGLPREFADRYTVRSPIGEGAFSVTYRAIDNSLQRDVAIKVLREQYVTHEGFDSRFEREARSAARISHPNVISVYDYGRQGTLPYIVMQYIDGPNLKEYVREEGPLTVEEAISFSRQILDGLAAIHDEGIIHRDVKPQNVLIDAGLQAKITDFGVAFTAVDPGLTETGMAVGTAAYMAPEQASGEQVGPGADIYAVGVILYELLTGRLPFPGDNPVQVMYRHVNEMPQPPRALNRSVPLAVEAVVLKALAKDSHDRFPSARAMRDALVSPGSSTAATAVAPAVVHPAAQMPVAGAAQARPTGQRATTTTAQRPRPPAPRRTQPSRKGSMWPVIFLLLIVAALVLTLITLLRPGAFAGLGSDPGPTPTQQVAAGADDDDATDSEGEPAVPTDPVAEPSPTPEAEPTAEPTEPEPTATEEPTTEPTNEPTPEPEPTEAPPGPTPTVDDDDDNGNDDDSGTAPLPTQVPSAQFNVPFDGRVLPSTWTNGSRAHLAASHLWSAGAGNGSPDFPADGALVDGLLEVEFTTTGSASSHIGVLINGMAAPGIGDPRLAIRLNGNLIWTGNARISEGEWTEVGWNLGNLQWLRNGLNVLSIETLDDDVPLLLLSATVFYA